MMKPGTARSIGLWTACAVVLLIAFVGFRQLHRTSTPVVNTAEAPPPTSRPDRPAPVSAPRATAVVPEAPADSAADANPMALSREKIEEYLKRHNRDAASLLAAHRALFDAEHGKGEIDYLREAATNFPNDPRVQLAVLAQNAFPEDRRQWLDAFKASSPSNSLANYLSARDYFQNNNTNAAIQELMEATGKAQFSDYSMESYLGVEDLFRSSDASPRITATAAMSAMAQDLLPQLAGMKGIVNSVGDLQKQYATSGDSASVQNLAQMGVGLASRFNQGDGGRFLIGQLVGMAIENIALQSLDPNTPYGFLGGQTPAQRLDALKQQKQVFRDLAVGSANLALMSDADMTAYADRVKVYGEVPAMQWFKEQHPDVNTQPK